MHYISVSDRRAWRAWLTENHASEKEVWLAYYKKHTGKATVTYKDSVKEALCFGWIDGLKKSIDEQKYAHRFTPRKVNSKWSPLNIRLAKELIETGEMTEAGLVAFNQRVPYDQELQKVLSAKEIPLTAETERGLKSSKKAWDNFNQMAAGYRKQYVAWLQSAKRPETRKKRLIEAIGLLEANKKLGMK
ncbi:MAG: YdeI/OmpD-associated family protein [Lysobacterales bacterium]